MDDSDRRQHQDAYRALNSDGPLGDKLERTHEVMRGHFPFLARIAVATYDPKSGILSAFARGFRAVLFVLFLDSLDWWDRFSHF